MQHPRSSTGVEPAAIDATGRSLTLMRQERRSRVYTVHSMLTRSHLRDEASSISRPSQPQVGHDGSPMTSSHTDCQAP